MSLSKQRFVTVCQQLLTTGAVLAVGVTAAGVLRLDIVTPSPSAQGEPQVSQGQPSEIASREQSAQTSPQDSQGRATLPARATQPAPVEEKVVDPTVREVAVVPESAPKPRSTPDPDPAQSPGAPSARGPKAPSARAAEPAPTPAATAPVVITSAPQKVTGYATVGVTWANGTRLDQNDIRILIRSHTDGVWSQWTMAEYHDDHAPDASSAEADRTRPGTDALVIGEADHVQVRAELKSGQLPKDTKLAIIDPGLGAQKQAAPSIETQPAAAKPEQAAMTSSQGPIALSAMRVSAAPTIYSRAQWGANESLRDKKALRYGTVQGGFVHHTVNANNYTAAQVPALIRGIYAYHTKSRGWSDIGYNFLVDRFGRIWEGRYGGVTRNPMGAHTLGYNDVAFAMSAIGNFETTAPPAALLESYAKLMAWKLSMAGIKANAKVTMHGKTFNAISGHRDAGSTACPGRYLYAKLGAIRARAAQIQAGATTTPPPAPAPAPAYNPLRTPAAATAQPAVVQPKGRSFAGSGQPDLVVAAPDGRLSTLITSRITAFVAVKSLAGKWNRFRATHPVGDLTGDGRPEFVNVLGGGFAGVWSTSASGGVSGIKGSKTRKLRGFVQFANVGDVTGDRRADLVGRRSASGALYLIPGRGQGRFKAPRVISAKWATNVTRMHTVGQVFGSRAADIIFETKSGALRLAPGRGDGRFGKSVRLPRVAGGQFIGYGNVDGRDRKDLVFRVGTEIFAYNGLGRGRFSTTAYGPIPGPRGLTRVVATNAVGSSQSDILGQDSAGRLVAAAHNGAVTFRGISSTSNPVLPVSAVLNVGDFNRDGRNDVITRHLGGDQLIFRPGRGDGTFANGISLGRGWAKVNQLAAVGDVTGDGIPDLAGRVGNTAVRIFPGNGKGAFLPLRWAPARLTTFGQVGSAPWRTPEVPASMLPSIAGTFVPIGGPTTATSARARVDSASYDVVVGVGDFDLDGITSDLIVRNRADGRLWLLRGNAAGGVASRVYLGSGFSGFSAIG